MSSCEEYYQATHPNWTVGYWDSINTHPGSAVPLPGSPLGVEVPTPTPDAPTDAGEQATSNPHLRSVLGDQFEEVTLQHRGTIEKNERHEAAAAGKWKEYYTQEIGDLVYDMYRVDFDTFGYRHQTFSR